MRYFINSLLFTLIISCGHKKHNECKVEPWYSKYGSVLTFNCGTITYEKGSNGCEIYGTYEKTYDNFLTWALVSNSCTLETQKEFTCYFAKSSAQEHGNFVCPDLKISEAFYLESL